MIYAGTKQEIEAKRKAFIRKWRLKCPAMGANLEEAGNKLFTVTQFSAKPIEIASDRAIERLHEEFGAGSRLRPSCHSRTAAMLLQGADCDRCSIRPTDEVSKGTCCIPLRFTLYQYYKLN